MLLAKRTNVIEMLNRVYKYNVSRCPAGPPDEKSASKTCFPGPKQLLNHSKMQKNLPKNLKIFSTCGQDFVIKEGGYS